MGAFFQVNALHIVMAAWVLILQTLHALNIDYEAIKKDKRCNLNQYVESLLSTAHSFFEFRVRFNLASSFSSFYGSLTPLPRPSTSLPPTTPFFFIAHKSFCLFSPSQTDLSFCLATAAELQNLTGAHRWPIKLSILFPTMSWRQLPSPTVAF